MNTARPSWLARYGVALGCALAATLLGRLFANPLLQTPFAWFVPAVAFSAWYGGLGPGLFCALLTVAGGWATMLQLSVPMSDEARIVKTALTLVAGVVVSALIASLRRARGNAAEEAAARAEAERRVRRVLESITDLFIRIDAAGNIEDINQRFAATLHLTESIVGRNFWEQFPNAVGGPFERELRRAVESGHPVTFEAPPALVPDLWFETHAHPEPGGGLSLYLRDITARKRSEQALVEADRGKDQFLAILAHELRNPLSPIRSAVQVLHLQPAPNAEIQWARDVIDRQVDHMTRLIEDLVDVSRVARNRLELRKEMVTLAEVIDAAIETSRPIIERHAHALSVSLPEERLVLDADMVRLSQVFMNLLTNAAKYTPPGGTIRVTAERAGGAVVVSVTDDGIGIHEEQLPRLFEMFFQVEDVLRRTQSGLGIGLALVRHVVELHGGSVSAHSGGAGQGTVIRVRLPIASGVPTANEAPPRSRTLRRLEPRRILVVDDNPDSAAALALLLRHAGAETFEAHDGPQALDVASRIEPDVVLLDIGLPNMNGYEVATAIRSQPWGAGAVLIAVTGWGQADDRERSRAAGFDHHVVKPVDPEALVDLLAGLPLAGGLSRSR